MTARSRLATLACLPLLAFALTAFAPDGDLDDIMGGLKNGLKSLSGLVKSADNDERTLGVLHEMQGLSMQGKLATPPRNDVPEARWDAHVKAYRADMARLLMALAQMEVDVLEGRHEKATGDLRDVLVKLRNDSHDKYK